MYLLLPYWAAVRIMGARRYIWGRLVRTDIFKERGWWWENAKLEGSCRRRAFPGKKMSG
jgi:hypothetical protein